MPDGDITLNAYFTSGEAEEIVDKAVLEELYLANKDTSPTITTPRRAGRYSRRRWTRPKAVLDDETATQTQVDAAENALKKAVEELTEQTEAVDKTCPASAL